MDDIDRAQEATEQFLTEVLSEHQRHRPTGPSLEECFAGRKYRRNAARRNQAAHAASIAKMTLKLIPGGHCKWNRCHSPLSN
jgi:hypothetical protein